MNLTDLPALLGGTPIRTRPYPPYPRAVGGELEAVAEVLSSDRWMDGEATQRFETECAAYLSEETQGQVVAVNTGGMALQVALRALGIEPGDEVLMRVDTCVADAYSVFNAGAVPIFADIDPTTFGMDWETAEAAVGPRTKALIVVHMWGYPERMDSARAFAQRHGLRLIDDACLALGTRCGGRMAGTLGDAGVFSFGWLKPIQAGGGGAVFTRDEAFAREMRSLRAWGDTEGEYGIRDQRELGWNGRLSEILAAVLSRQLAGYPEFLATLRENAVRVEARLTGLNGLQPLRCVNEADIPAYPKFLLKVDEQALGFSLDTLAAALEAEGIPEVWHGAFEPYPEFDFFASGRWRTWALGHPDHARLHENYTRPYPGAEHLYHHAGIGLGRNVLMSPDAVEDTAAILHRIQTHAPRLADWERQTAE